MIPKNLKYTKEHEWVKLEGSEAVIGITDHAQSQLGDITFIELPQKDRQIKQSDSISTVESVKAASDIYSPVSGTITDVNSSLEDAPELINQSPYENGWICRVNVSNSGELDNLMDADSYEEYLKEAE